MPAPAAEWATPEPRQPPSSARSSLRRPPFSSSVLPRPADRAVSARRSARAQCSSGWRPASTPPRESIVWMNEGRLHWAAQDRARRWKRHGKRYAYYWTPVRDFYEDKIDASAFLTHRV